MSVASNQKLSPRLEPLITLVGTGPAPNSMTPPEPGTLSGCFRRTIAKRECAAADDGALIVPPDSTCSSRRNRWSWRSLGCPGKRSACRRSRSSCRLRYLHKDLRAALLIVVVWRCTVIDFLIAALLIVVLMALPASTGSRRRSYDAGSAVVLLLASPLIVVLTPLRPQTVPAGRADDSDACRAPARHSPRRHFRLRTDRLGAGLDSLQRKVSVIVG